MSSTARDTQTGADSVPPGETSKDGRIFVALAAVFVVFCGLVILACRKQRERRKRELAARRRQDEERRAGEAIGRLEGEGGRADPNNLATLVGDLAEPAVPVAGQWRLWFCI